MYLYADWQARKEVKEATGKFIYLNYKVGTYICFVLLGPFSRPVYRNSKKCPYILPF
jgi:hypothetical protein